jgi:hypothetical protein
MTTRKSTTRLHSSDKVSVRAFDRIGRCYRITEGYMVRPRNLPEFARREQWAVTRLLLADGILGSSWTVTHIGTGAAIGWGEKTRDEAILRAAEVMDRQDGSTLQAALAKVRAAIRGNAHEVSEPLAA